MLRIACKQIRIVVHFELRPRYIGTVQKYFTNKLCSSPRTNNNNFFTTECFVLPLLQRLQCRDYYAVGVLIRFGIRLPNAYIQKFDSKNDLLI